MNKTKKKTFLYLGLTVAITLGLSISVQSLIAAWVPPQAEPPTMDEIHPPVYNEGTSAIPMIIRPLGISGNLTVSDGNLYMSDNDIKECSTIEKDADGNVVIQLGS